MRTLIGFKVKIYPNKKQKEIFMETIGACRWVFNHYLEKRKENYLENKKAISYYELSKDLVKLRHKTPWLEKVQFKPLQQSLRQLDTSYNRFFRKQSKFPRFKSKKTNRLSFNKAEKWRVIGNKIKVFDNVLVKFRGRFVDKRYGSLTISVDKTGQWYASTFGFEEKKQSKLKGNLGIDLGLNHVAITSNGDKYNNPKFLKTYLYKIKNLHRESSRKKTGSRRKEKIEKQIAILYKKITNKRINYLHHISKAIVSENQAMIAVEDLAISNMMKNQKVSRQIADTSWYELLRQLQYKQEWLGGKFIKIDRFFPTSKMCSNCNYIVNSLPLYIRDWQCPKCHSKHDRDINAAINIKRAGYQLCVESTKSSKETCKD